MAFHRRPVPLLLGALLQLAAANAVAAEADVVLGIGTRYSDFTTASRTAFGAPDVRFVNVNVAPIDAVKHSGVSVVADARETLEALTAADALFWATAAAAFNKAAREK